MKVRQTVGN